MALYISQSACGWQGVRWFSRRLWAFFFFFNNLIRDFLEAEFLDPPEKRKRLFHFSSCSSQGNSYIFPETVESFRTLGSLDLPFSTNFRTMATAPLGFPTVPCDCDTSNFLLAFVKAAKRGMEFKVVATEVELYRNFVI